MRKHKVFNEFHREGDVLYLRMDLPQHNEHYIGVGRLVSVEKTLPFGLRLKKEDFQSLTMIDCPTTLLALMKSVTDNSGTYDEETDKYIKLDVKQVFEDSIKDLIKTTTEMVNKVCESLDPQSEEYKFVMDNANNLINAYEEVGKGKWKDRLSPTTRTLVDLGFTPIWVENAVRTRVVTLVRHLDDNALLICHVKEFIPRDSRKANNFMIMNTITLPATACEAFLNNK